MSFGYLDKPEIGIFNPARSLFATDSSLYGSLFATKERPGSAWKPEAVKLSRAAVKSAEKPFIRIGGRRLGSYGEGGGWSTSHYIMAAVAAFILYRMVKG